MPNYNYCCFECDPDRKKTVSVVCSIATRFVNTPKCRRCGRLMIQNFNDGNVMIVGAEYKKPLHSDALGMQPDQVAEHRRMFPNIEIDKQNRPVFHNMPEHQDYMDKCGIVKHKQKVKPSGETIATLKTNS